MIVATKTILPVALVLIERTRSRGELRSGVATDLVLELRSHRFMRELSC
jgi:hypothetical protein